MKIVIGIIAGIVVTVIVALVLLAKGAGLVFKDIVEFFWR